MWETFRAVARRIGLSVERVEAVERGGVAVEVEHPVAEGVHILVRPDPDWRQRMMDAWTGELVNSRREVAGDLVLDAGAVQVGDADRPGENLIVPLAPGTYRLVLTAAHRGSEESFDHDEAVSHAFLFRSDGRDVAAIEPCLGEKGVQLGVKARQMTFAVPGALPRIAGDHAGRWTLRLHDARRAQTPPGDGPERYSVTIPDEDGSTAVIAAYVGEGRAEYHLCRLADADGRTVGLAADFGVDNRPWN